MRLCCWFCLVIYPSLRSCALLDNHGWKIAQTCEVNELVVKTSHVNHNFVEIFLALMFYSRCTIKSQPNVGQYVIHESFRKEKCFQFDFQVREFLFRLQSGDSDMFMSGVMRVALP